MSTPTYKGQGQPAATSGGWLSGWFGGTPAYKPAPPATTSTPSASAPSASPASNSPSPTSANVPTAIPRGSFFAFKAPAYKLAPPSQSNDCAERPKEVTIVIPREAFEAFVSRSDADAEDDASYPTE